MSTHMKERLGAFNTIGTYDNLGEYKINADYIKMYAYAECYRELMVSVIPMLPLLEHTVPFKEADYILYMHFYARCDDYSEFVANQLRLIAKERKPGAEIIVVGKAANAEKILNGEISNITFWGDHYTEKLGKRFGFDIKEEYFVYDDRHEHLAIWPVNGCLLKCKFCRRCYMDIKFESISLEEIRANLDRIRATSPEQMKKISLRAENLTEYGVDIYGKPMLHKVIELIESYDEVETIEMPIGICIGEINDELLTALCNSKKITGLALNIEAGTDRLLHLIGKPHTCSKVKYVFGKLREAKPDLYISTNVLLGLPTEQVGDVYDTARLILELRPNYLKINYFVCSPKSPLAKYPQFNESRCDYHLRQFLYFLEKLDCEESFVMKISRHRLEKRPYTRAYCKELAENDSLSKELVSMGFLPRFLGVKTKNIFKKIK